MENSMAVPQTTKNKIIMWSSTWYTFGYISQRTESRGVKRYLYTQVHSIVCNSQKVKTTQVSPGRWMNKTWQIHTMKCYSALKRKEVRIHATAWMNLEVSVVVFQLLSCISLPPHGRQHARLPSPSLSEISQSWKDKYYMIVLLWGTQSGQVHRDRKQNGGCWALGGGGMGSGFTGTGFQFCRMKHVLAMHAGDGLHNNANIFNATELYTLKK